MAAGGHIDRTPHVIGKKVLRICIVREKSQPWTCHAEERHGPYEHNLRDPAASPKPKRASCDCFLNMAICAYKPLNHSKH
ncbi:hypothetical protein M8818_006136 [Zalaria obscura]|uniref:Uncharacterized protein n=1 Tax=Zalaria obscura TaxID=2024903 RepID=A0ACC3S711_9PEZI